MTPGVITETGSLCLLSNIDKLVINNIFLGGIIMKRKLLSFFIGATLLLGSTSVTFAGGYQDYTHYLLCANCANNYTNGHEKATGDDFIINEVEKLENTKKATFWATDGDENRISNTYDFVKGENKTIEFKWSKGLDAKEDVKMGMENAEWSSDVAVVSGKVDFR